MSDLAQSYPVSERQKIQSVISDSLFAAYGIVQVVNGAMVDVQMAIQTVALDGTVLDPQILRGIEVLFPSSGGMSQSWELKPGDGVLIVGLQSLVPSTNGLTQPAAPVEYWNYSSQTAKAIPLSGTLKGLVAFGEAGGKAFLRNAASSLYTVINNLVTDLETFATAASSASTAAQIAAAAAILAPQLTAVSTALGALLEA